MGPADDQSPVDAGDDDAHALFARDYCQACPRGVVPRPGGSGRRCCITRVTSTVTKTRTTTRVKTTTVKIVTRTTSKTITQSAAVRMLVSVRNDAGQPVANARVDLVGPSPTARRLAERQDNVVTFCITNISGLCTILVRRPLLPTTQYILRFLLTSTFFQTNTFGQPPPPPNGETYPIVVDNPSTIRLGRRELLARREADGNFRRAIKARATPAPDAF
ncbi:hypothetical protein DFJ74DRAFT_647862 [Hyaloraphidium curvatum]|nr:hypothetical protein DFJ74DRAFT_647862 [Hyaloraphidium curvatum]